MSSQVYTLKIDINDSKIRDIERRLMNIVNGGQQGATITNLTGGGSATSQKSGMMKNIGKLAMISTGVLTIVILLKSLMEMITFASPMLKQMLKLFHFGVTLILRPIGDFIGFFLRPIIMYFLLNIAKPWFTTVMPIMRDLGNKMGKNFVDDPIGGILKATPIGLLVTALPLISQNLEAHWLKFVSNTKKWIDSLNLPTWDEMIKGITDWIDSLGLPTWDEMIKGITDWIDSLGLPTFDEMIKGITDWIDSLGLPTFDEMIKGITDWIDSLSLPTWDNMVKGITDWIDSLSLPSWDDITNIFTSLKSALQSLAGSIGGFLGMLAKIFGIDLSGGGNNNNNSGGGRSNRGNVQEEYQFPDLGEFQNQFSEWSNKLSDTLKGVP